MKTSLLPLPSASEWPAAGHLLKGDIICSSKSVTLLACYAEILLRISTYMNIFLVSIILLMGLI